MLFNQNRCQMMIIMRRCTTNLAIDYLRRLQRGKERKGRFGERMTSFGCGVFTRMKSSWRGRRGKGKGPIASDVRFK